MLSEMALMRMAVAWEKFVLKDLATASRYAKVGTRFCSLFGDFPDKAFSFAFFSYEI